MWVVLRFGWWNLQLLGSHAVEQFKTVSCWQSVSCEGRGIVPLVIMTWILTQELIFFTITSIRHELATEAIIVRVHSLLAFYIEYQQPYKPLETNVTTQNIGLPCYFLQHVRRRNKMLQLTTVLQYLQVKHHWWSKGERSTLTIHLLAPFSHLSGKVRWLAWGECVYSIM